MKIKNLPDGSLVVWLSARDTYDWAHRAGGNWPCSTTSGHRLVVGIASNGDIQDFAIDGKDGNVDSHELDCLLRDFGVRAVPNVR